MWGTKCPCTQQGPSCTAVGARILTLAAAGPRAGPAEEDLKLLQRGGLAPRPRLAARLRLAEKRVLQGTMDAVRRCGGRAVCAGVKAPCLPSRTRRRVAHITDV